MNNSGSPHHTSAQDVLTANPTLTVAWICAGVIPLQTWWVALVRKWWIELTTTEKRVQGVKQDRGKLTVCEFILSITGPLSKARG